MAMFEEDEGDGVKVSGWDMLLCFTVVVVCVCAASWLGLFFIVVARMWTGHSQPLFP